MSTAAVEAPTGGFGEDEWAAAMASPGRPATFRLPPRAIADPTAGNFTPKELAEAEHYRQNQAEEAQTRPTWAPMELESILSGTYEPAKPELMPRTDGKFLLYPGYVHSFHGESESGKSLVAQSVVARILAEGGRACYIDFESDPALVVGRLLQMGAPADAIRERFHYIRPEADFRSTEEERAAWHTLCSEKYDLVIIDGVTEAASLFGVASKDNDDYTGWNRLFARKLARATGAAVIQIDHVTKDSESRGRFAIGAQAKMSALDGAGYLVEVKKPLGVGMLGLIAMRVVKDRPGQVRPVCGPYRSSDRTQEAARVVVDSTEPGRIAVTIDPPEQATGEDGAEKPFRPTGLMEKVSRWLEDQEVPQSGKSIENGVTGAARHIRTATQQLVTEGYIVAESGPRNGVFHRSVKAYRQAEDPESDQCSHLTSSSSRPRPDLVPDEVIHPLVTSSSSPPLYRGTRTRSRDEVEGTEPATAPQDSHIEPDLWGNFDELDPPDDYAQ